MKHKHHFFEDHKRSIAKTFTWRALAMTTTMCVAYFVTGEPIVALGIGGVASFAKLFLYYFHERAWNHVKWGKASKKK